MTDHGRTLTLTAAGTFVTLAAFTLPLVTVNETAAGLEAGPAGRTWILSSMSIGLGALLLTAGRLADDFGRRRAFVAGALVTAVGAVAAVLAQGVVWFVLARIVQGAGGAALTAASLGIIGHTFTTAAERGRATAIWGASLGAGIAAGPLVSAGLARAHSWRDAYVALAVAGLALALAGRGLTESSTATRSRPDLPGVLTLVLGLSALLAGLTEGREDWTDPWVVLLLVVGVLLLAAFVLLERRTPEPMLDLRLFRRPDFVAVTIAALVTGGGVIAQMSYLSGFAGRALGISSWTAAVLFLAWSGTSVVVSLAARSLPESVSGRVRLGGSLPVVALGLLLLAHVSVDTGPGGLVLGMLVAGLGSGVLNAALGRESVTSVPVGQAGLGSGANNTARYLGSALGVTVVSVVAVPAGALTPVDLVSGWNHAALITTAVTLLGALAVLVVGERAQASVLVGE